MLSDVLQPERLSTVRRRLEDEWNALKRDLIAPGV